MSTSINIAQLVTGGKSRTSKGQSLTGMLFVVSKESSLARGTIELVDFTSEQMALCVVDQFIPTYHRVIVSIKEWNYIFDAASGYRYLEFKMDSVFYSNDTLSVIRRHIKSESKTYSKQPHVFYIPSPTLSCAEKRNVALAGQIHSISPLIVVPKVTSYFFLQLTRDRSCVTIRFSGKGCEYYYHYFLIGSYHVFQNLSIIKKGERTIFSFGKESCTCTITATQYADITIQPNSLEYPLTVTSVEKPRQFTGCITRIIDTLFGIYELESKLLVCLFHYMNYSPQKPYRIGTRITISHFHTTKVQSLTTSHLLSLWEMKNDCPVLVSCQMTRIEIQSFPTHSQVLGEDMQTVSFKLLVYLDVIKRQLDFSSLLQQLEIYAALESKFSKSMDLDLNGLFKTFNIIRKHLLENDENQAYSIDFDSFFSHDDEDSGCQVFTRNSDKNVIQLISYPSLENVKSSLEDNLAPYQLDLIGENHFNEQHKVLIKSAELNQEHQLLGRIDMLDDGRLVLVDNTCNILINTTENIELGAIYLCKKVRLFSEDLSYLNSLTFEKTKLDCRYISCNGHDLYLVYRPHQQIFQIEQDISSVGISRFICDGLTTVVNHPVVVAHVIDKLPLEFSVLGNDIECRLVVMLYSLTDSTEHNISIDSGKRILVTNKRNRSLKFNRQLQLNKWYVILDLIQLGSNENDKTFFLSEKCHKIYPIVITPRRINYAIQLTAIVSDDAVSVFKPPIPKPVYNVSQLAVYSLSPDESYQERADFYYTEPMDVQGIIISKRLLKGSAQSHSTCDDKAADMYDKFGIGTGKYERKLQIQLRQLNRLDTLVIYLDSKSQHYPLGLIPGARVTFRNLLRKHSYKGFYNFYCTNRSTSTIQVESTHAPKEDHVDLDNVPKIALSQLQKELVEGKEPEDTIFKAYCFVNLIVSLRFKWLCKTCESVIRNSNCFNLCQEIEHVFTASAYVKISDNTETAHANVDGEKLVFGLLDLTQAQADELKHFVFEHGELYYQGKPGSTYSNLPEKIDNPLKDLCSKAISRGHIWIYAKRQFKKEESGLSLLKLPKEKKNREVFDVEKAKLKVIVIKPDFAANIACQLLLEGLDDFINNNNTA
ncbi:CST, telomere maintenance, complex subunit CTC1-domain-containing protein [Pilaira anomala]|nr:CST, telomere maintenance, complex subunit CTC1-domain-containing protein [Pilaira anomala]